MLLLNYLSNNQSSHACKLAQTWGIAFDELDHIQEEMEDFVGIKRVRKSDLLGGTIAKSLDIYAEILHTH